MRDASKRLHGPVHKVCHDSGAVAHMSVIKMLRAHLRGRAVLVGIPVKRSPHWSAPSVFAEYTPSDRRAIWVVPRSEVARSRATAAWRPVQGFGAQTEDGVGPRSSASSWSSAFSRSSVSSSVLSSRRGAPLRTRILVRELKSRKAPRRCYSGDKQEYGYQELHWRRLCWSCCGLHVLQPLRHDLCRPGGYREGSCQVRSLRTRFD